MLLKEEPRRSMPDVTLNPQHIIATRLMDQKSRGRMSWHDHMRTRVTTTDSDFDWPR
jgi:hypothetical protein